jgi:hypothetical protein
MFWGFAGPALLAAALVAYVCNEVRRGRRQSSPAAVGESLLVAPGPCQACGGGLSGHWLYELFQFIEATELRMAEIDRQVRVRDWKELVGRNSYDPQRDTFAYWFAECPATKAGGLYRVWSSASLDGPGDRRDRAGALDAGETAELLARLRDNEPLELS